MDDGAGQKDGAGDSDDDAGFRMFSAEDMKGSAASRPSQFKPLKVVNLLDFGELNDPSEPQVPAVASPKAEAPAGGRLSRAFDAAPAVAVEGADTTPRRPGPEPDGAAAAHGSPGRDGPLVGGFVDAAARAEIEHLRQMLADANEERSIQVAIVQDEVAEKQQLIEELRRQKSDAEALVASQRQEIDELRRGFAEAQARAEAPAEADETSKEPGRRVSEAQAGVIAPQQATAALLEELGRLHVRTLRTLGSNEAAVRQARVEDEAALSGKHEDLDVRLARLRDAAAALNEAAEKSIAERRPVAEAHLGSPLPMTRAVSEDLPGMSPSSRRRAGSAETGWQAAQALREVRLNAERQLQWITDKIVARSKAGRPSQAPHHATLKEAGA